MNLTAKVIKHRCISCGSCNIVAPTVFDFDDEGLAYNIIDDNAGLEQIALELQLSVLEAENCCPTKAILTSKVPPII
ncbi:MAG: ferredoxin [Culicoidibacterales bacterium]